jgi:hypothetical protein
MLISMPNVSTSNTEFALTPTMIRGAFLIWRFELQRGQQFAEIRNLDCQSAPDISSPKPSGNISILNRPRYNR